MSTSLEDREAFVFAESCRTGRPADVIRAEIDMDEPDYPRDPEPPAAPCEPKEECCKVKAHDPVNHPPHYTQGIIEPIDAIESWSLGFCLGNVVKYIARAGHKGDRLQDLRKARWYLEREIQREGKLRE